MVALYLFCSILVGFLIFVDGMILLKQKGRLNGNLILIVTTTIEFLWVIVSIISLLYLEFMSWYAFIPFGYLCYNIIGWKVGQQIVSEMGNPEDALWSMVIPRWWINFGVIFGLIFTLLANYAYAHLC